LAASTENLVRYLDSTPQLETATVAPRDEMHRFLEEAQYHFPTLEKVGAVGIPNILAMADISDEAKWLLHTHLDQYCIDIIAIPMPDLIVSVKKHEADPFLLAEDFDVPLAQLFRRLITLPPNEAKPFGLVIADPAGAILFRKSIADFDIPLMADACPLWPVFHAFAQPHSPVVARLIQKGGAKSYVRAIATLDIRSKNQFDALSLSKSVMLLMPDTGKSLIPAQTVGSTCKICTKTKCFARRETSIISEST